MKVSLWVQRASAALSLLFVLLLLTSGWALMATYVPSDSEAFASVLFLRRAGGVGSFARTLHHYLASGLVISGFLYLISVYLCGQPCRDRSSWILGVSAYLVVLGLCFTGFLLPMDQNAYWGTVVRLGIVESSPVVGELAADLLRGGAAFNASTLPRFYALHVSILPCLLGLLLAGPLIRLMGDTDRRQRVRWLGAVLGVIALLYTAMAILRAPLELPADPSDNAYVPRPEWYFLWLFQLGKYLEAMPWIQSLILPVAGLGFIYAVPWLRPGSLRRRGVVAGGWCLAWIGLTTMAVWQDRELPENLQYEAAMLVRAEANYQQLCLDCHGSEGRGDGPQARAFNLETPDFTAADVWRARSLEEMRRAVLNGQGKDMPSFKQKLDSEEVNALLDYLKTTFGPAAL